MKKYFVALVMILSVAGNAQANVILSEILMNPPVAPWGDTNGDGLTSSTQDEFIELYNESDSSLDLSGWKVSDDLRVRHVVPPGTILPSRAYLVIFGGGSPQNQLSDWQKASSGSLGLNNTVDTVSLLDAVGLSMDRWAYDVNSDFRESIVRYPTTQIGDWIDHSSIDSRLFSPGEGFDVTEKSTSVTPEPTALAYLMVSLPGLFFHKRFFKKSGR